jgi:hypothetical protein
LSLRVGWQFQEDAHKGVRPEIGEIISIIIGVDRAKERVVGRRIGQSKLLESLIPLFHKLGGKLKGSLWDVARRAAPTVAMHVWKIDAEEGCSAVRIATFRAGICGLKGGADGDSH